MRQASAHPRKGQSIQDGLATWEEGQDRWKGGQKKKAGLIYFYVSDKRPRQALVRELDPRDNGKLIQR
jgi:hypothetical protein